MTQASAREGGEDPQIAELEKLLSEMINEAYDKGGVDRKKVAKAYQMACHLAKQAENVAVTEAKQSGIEVSMDTLWSGDDIHSWAHTIMEKVDEGHATATMDFASDGADLNSWTLHVTLTDKGREAIEQDREVREQEERTAVLGELTRLSREADAESAEPGGG